MGVDTASRLHYTRAHAPSGLASAREEVTMSVQPVEGWTRRRFLGGLTLAGTAGLLGLHARPSAAEPPPETTTLRVWEEALTTCIAPTWAAQELLYSEGFTDVHYVTWGRQ